MPSYTAEWVLPISGEPMRRGAVSIDEGRIAAVHDSPPLDAADLGPVAIMPALVNAHTHLELSYLRGKVPPTERFLDWIRTIMSARRQYPDAADPRILDAARAAIADAHASGTGLLGDISNTLVTAPLLRGQLTIVMSRARRRSRSSPSNWTPCTASTRRSRKPSCSR